MLTQVEVLEYLIAKGPGRTEIELATAIHGSKAYQQRVNQDCALLLNRGSVQRRGAGGPGAPHRYYPAGDRN